MNLTQPAIARGALAVGALALSLLSASALSASSNGQHLEGSWSIQILPEPGTPLPPSFAVMHTFLPGGAMVETASLPFAHGGGHGEWLRVGNREFRYTFQFFAKDPAGNPTLVAKVRQRVVVNEAKTEFVSCVYTGEVFDEKGTRVLTDKGTCKGKRIDVDLNEP
jgi:hypothetical protein